MVYMLQALEKGFNLVTILLDKLEICFIRTSIILEQLDKCPTIAGIILDQLESDSFLSSRGFVYTDNGFHLNLGFN